MSSVELFLESSNRAKNEKQLFDTFEKVVASYGVDTIGYLLLTDHPSINKKQNIPVITTFPEDWVQEYIEKQYHLVDPAVRLVHTMPRPFVWDEIHELMKVERPVERFIGTVREAGLKDGIAVPLFGPGGEVGYVAMASRTGKLKFSPKQQQELWHIAQQLHFVYGSFSPKPKEAKSFPMLSQREREVLQWVSAGKSNSVIAEILTISEHTVDTVLRRCYRKLGVSNRIAAVVQASRWGIIYPDFAA